MLLPLFDLGQHITNFGSKIFNNDFDASHYLCNCYHSLCCVVTVDYVDGYGEVEFLNALVVPLRDSSGVTFMKGVDGFPAFSFASTANVYRPASELVYRIGPDFSFVASILPLSAAGGYVSEQYIPCVVK